MNSASLENQCAQPDAREELKQWISAEKKKGLVDIKFCLGNVNTAGVSVEQAAKQFLSIVKAKKEGRTRAYADF